MDHYRNVDNTMRSYYDIAAQWRIWGVTPDKRIAFYCGTGWRASEAFFYAHLMGWATVAVYDGGWWAWVQDPTNPTDGKTEAMIKTSMACTPTPSVSRRVWAIRP
jgi:thiosulfate/3-mercaptopyruvate sulfurtransferase